MIKLITFISTLLLLIASTSAAQTQGTLENPADGSSTSGIYMFSGWACNAELIEIVIDGGSGIKAAYGTDRGDTEATCGDRDNGFGLLFNMALLGDGFHEAVAFADGQEIGRSTFAVTTLSGKEFLRDKAKLAIAYNFPSYGKEVWLEWVESAQNFLMVREQNTPDPLDVSGIWVEPATGTVVAISTYRQFADRQEFYAVATNIDPSSTFLGGVYVGSVIGNTAQVSAVLPEAVNLDGTITFGSAAVATLTINRCYSSDPSISCAFPEGSTVALLKLTGQMDQRTVDVTDLMPAE